MKELDVILKAVHFPYYVQLYTHGRHYNGSLKEVNGEWYFRFYNKWHRVDEYVDDHTRIVHHPS